MKHFNAFLLIVFAFTAAVLINGCNLAPAYHPPTVQTPPAFKETNGWKLAQPSDGVIKGKWWEAFNDPQLNHLEEQVAISNQNIAAALQNFFAARALVKEARAGYYPVVSLDPSVSKSHSVLSTAGSGSSTNTVAGSGGNRNISVFSLPGDATWEPDLWGAIRNTVRADVFAAQASAAQIENMKLTAQTDLAVDYYNLRGQDELIHLFNDTVHAYRESVSLTTTLFQTGIDSELDEAQADALLQTTLAQATALGISRAQYEHAIALLIGQPASTFSIKAQPLTNPPPVVPVGLPSALLERRPDIAAAERTVAQASAEIGVTRAAWFPSLSLSGSAGYESTSISQLISPDNFFWAVGATLSETVFDAGKRKAANEQAWAAYRSTIATYRQTVLTAFQQVEDDLSSMRILSDEGTQQDVAIRASQKSLDLSMERYRQGIASYLNVISAQESLLANQQTAVGLRAQHMVSAVQLITALGGGWTNAALPSSHGLALKNSPDGK